MKEEFVVAVEDAGARLDRYVAARFADLSRSRVQELIETGLVRVNGRATKGSHRLRAGERIQADAQPRPPLRAEPEAIPLEILYEDEDVLVVNKSAGMAVHAGAGASRGTLVNALLGRGQALSRGGDVLRPGIVHRLDKETSGAILIAKNDAAHARLAEAFTRREIKKTYLALVEGKLAGERGRIELAISRDPKRRVRMAPVPPGPGARGASALSKAREARTDWRALARIGGCTLVEVQLHTGRTHQIRVHFSALRHPIVGDTLYGAARQKRAGKVAIPALHRNFLHAVRLGFAHPRSGKWIDIVAPLPADLLAYARQMAVAAGEDPLRIDAALRGYL